MARQIMYIMLSLIGAVLGGVLGHYAFHWIWSQGFYAPFVPGAFIGLGCAALSGHKSIIRGIFCGVAGIGLGLFTRWTNDAHEVGFKEFITHFYDYLSTISQIMLGLGGLLAFWIGQGTFGAPWGRQKQLKAQPPPEQRS